MTYLPGTVGQECSLLITYCRPAVQPVYAVYDLPPGNCWTGVQPVKEVSEPSSWGLSSRDAACLCGVRTFFLGTVKQRSSLFMWCPNLAPWDCWSGVQPVYAVSGPTSWDCWAGV